MTHVAAQARVPKRAFIVFAVVSVLLLALAAVAVVRGMVEESRRMQIVSVIDGNTVVVDDHGTERTVTMAGVVSSIRNPDDLTGGPNLCLGERSYMWLRDRLVEGATAQVDLERTGEQTYGVFHLGGEDVNVEMAAAGMAAPVQRGASAAVYEDVAQANSVAQSRGRGLYSPEESCTYNSRLHEAQFAMNQISTEADPTIAALDERSVELAEAVDQVRLVREDIAALDEDGEDFEDLVWVPAREALLEEADSYAETGLASLRELNARRNELATR